MKGIVRGVVGLALALSASACTNDETLDVGRDYNRIQVNPTALFVSINDSTAVRVRLIDDLNRATPTSYTVSNVGAGLSVNYDPNYRPDFTQGGDSLSAPLVKPEQRYFVRGTAVGLYEYTLTSSTGVAQNVRVYVTPDNLSAALSTTTAVAGQAVTITAPSGLRFSDNSVVTFTSGATPFITNRAADGSSITFIVNPNTSGTAGVTNVTYLFSPTAPAVTLRTTDLITVPQVTIPISASTATPGQTVTITAPAGLKFSPTSAVSFPTGSISITNRAADGSTISFLVGPNVTGAATVTLLTYTATPAAPAISLATSTTLTTPALTNAITTVSNAAPDIGAPVTVTLGGSLRFLPDSKVLIGGREAGIESVSADSSTAVIVPMLGSSGAVTYTNIALSFLNTVKLALPSDGKTIAVTSVYVGPSANGTGTLATAPTIPVPAAAGRSIIITDAGPFFAGGACATAAFGGTTGCRIYKITLPAARTADVELRWAPTVADLGAFRLTDALVGTVLADAFGGQNGGPEVSAAAGVAFVAGVNYLVIGTFDATPAYYQLRVTFR